MSQPASPQQVSGTVPLKPFGLLAVQVKRSTPPCSIVIVISVVVGTSLDMIDRTYGHLAPDAEAVELALLNSYDFARGTRSDVR